MIGPYYYLHNNGSLLFKPHAEERDFLESDLVKSFWPVDLEDRANAWTILVEGAALGAHRGRVNSLANDWGCDNVDAAVFAAACDCVLIRRSEDYAVAPRGGPDIGGTGPDALWALVDLAIRLGVRSTKDPLYIPFARLCAYTAPTEIS